MPVSYHSVYTNIQEIGVETTELQRKTKHSYLEGPQLKQPSEVEICMTIEVKCYILNLRNAICYKLILTGV